MIEHPYAIRWEDANAATRGFPNVFRHRFFVGKIRAINPDVAPNLPDAIRQKVALAAAAAEEWEARADVVLPARVWGVNWPLVASKRD